MSYTAIHAISYYVMPFHILHGMFGFGSIIRMSKECEQRWLSATWNMNNMNIGPISNL